MTAPASIAQPKAAVGSMASSKTSATGSMQTAAESVVHTMMRSVEKRARTGPSASM